jgi:hypothetical protein
MNTERIRELNDAFRTTFAGGSVMVTAGVRALGDIDILLARVRNFEDFNDDPHKEHDFGALDFADQKIFWKIDYYDRRFEVGSDDPSNPAVTSRVLTVMLADEY